MANDFNKPVVGDNHATLYTPTVVSNFQALAVGADPGYVTINNPPTHMLRFNKSAGTVEEFGGVSWATWAPTPGWWGIRVASANAFATPRNIAMTGFVNWNVNFDGSGNATASCTLSGALGVGNGGTGATSFTSGGLLVGNGAAAVGIATAAQIVAAIGATAVTNAANATTAASCSGNTAGTASNITAYTINQSVGTGNSPSFVDVTITSDESLKTNWRALPHNLIDRLAYLKRGIYDRTDAELTQVGASAQSMQSILPQAVVADDAGKLQISQSATHALLGELAAYVVLLRHRIDDLERRA